MKVRRVRGDMIEMFKLWTATENDRDCQFFQISDNRYSLREKQDDIEERKIDPD